MTEQIAVREAHDTLLDIVTATLRMAGPPSSRAALATEVDGIVAENGVRLEGIDRRNLVTILMRSLEQTATDLLNAAKACGKGPIRNARRTIDPLVSGR